jgi:hypothetical protein
MEWLQHDYLKIKIQLLADKIWRNKMVSFLMFILLVSAIIFIQLHPHSVWYYFAAGFFTSKMLDLIFEKTKLKLLISEATSRLVNIKRGINL